jgi:hypothetical protein
MADFSMKYYKLAHAIQSGIEFNKDADVQSPKHLRVGVNLRAVELGALMKLLTDKGIITVEEYEEALLTAMREEVARYEMELSEQYGSKVTLA